MKALAAILLLAVSASAQDAPVLTHALAENGDLVLTWPVHILRAGNSQLAATYQPEICDRLPAWHAIGSPIVGVNGPNRTSSARFPNLREKPASFLRVRATFDFSGRVFNFAGFTNAILNNVIFQGASLFGAQLDGSRLNNANFAGADLRTSSIREVIGLNANFSFARMSDADVSSSDFTGANFSFAELSAADLTFSRLRDADLRGAILQDAIINFTSLHGCRIDDNTVLDARALAVWRIVNNRGAGLNFSNADLSFADLSDGNLENCSLVNANLDGADLQRANLADANLSNASLRHLDLRGTMITETTQIPAKWRLIWDIINNPRAGRVHDGAILSQGFWVESTFERAGLRAADFNFGLMLDVNFNEVSAGGAIFRNAEFHGSTFRNANLRNANFSLAILNDVDFTGANITGANFAGASFSNVTMPDGSIRNN